MSKLNYERLAVAALDALLGGGLEITQHYYTPDPNEWYFAGPMGNVGPFETPELQPLGRRDAYVPVGGSHEQ